MSGAPPKPWERGGVPNTNSSGHEAPASSHSCAAAGAPGQARCSGLNQSVAWSQRAAADANSRSASAYGNGHGSAGYGGYNGGHGGGYGSGYSGGGYGGGYSGGYGGGYGAGAAHGGYGARYGGGAFGGGVYSGGPFGAFGRGIDPDKDPMPPGLRHLEDLLFSIGRITQMLEMNFEVMQHFLGSASALFERLANMYHDAQRASSVIHRQSLEFGESSFSVVRRVRSHARDNPVKCLGLAAFCLGLLARFVQPKLRRRPALQQAALLDAFAAAAAARAPFST